MVTDMTHNTFVIGTVTAGHLNNNLAYSDLKIQVIFWLLACQMVSTLAYGAMMDPQGG